MAKVKITGHASGTGILTVTAPNTSTDRTITLPDATGTVLTTTSANPASSDGAALGSASLEWSDLYLADSGIIYFGDDQDVSIKQVGDGEISIKRNSTSDDSYPALFLDTGETDIAVNDVLGAIHFRAPDEAAGTDAILAGASILAKSEGDFSSSNNATTLHFRTAASGSPTDNLKITSDGRGISAFTASAWVNFNGLSTVAIRDSLNISSVTDQGTGLYRPNYANNLADVNYSVSIASSVTYSAYERPRVGSLAVGSCDITNEDVTNGTDYDSEALWLQVIGGN